MVVVSETGSKTAAICCAYKLSGLVSAAVETGVSGTTMSIISKTMTAAFGRRLRFSAFAPTVFLWLESTPIRRSSVGRVVVPCRVR